jgi:nitrile hydratase
MDGIEPDEPVFHDEWEGRTFAVAGAALGAGGFNTPMFRHAIERMDPGHYLTSSYYEHWLTAVATLLVEAGIVERAELGAGFALSGPVLVGPDDVPDLPVGGYGVGDRVRVREIRFAGHTRCPGYVQGRVGTIVRIDEPAPVPELEAHRSERVTEPAYGVRFAATELWGPDADPAAAVHVDLSDRYLEPV